MRRLFVIVMVCVAAFGARPVPAAAHAEVFESDPGRDGTIPTGTDEITLTLISFDRHAPVTITVTSDDGTEYAVGDAMISDLDSVITQAVRPLDAGGYVVEWMAMSSDGDGPADGSYEFRAEDVGGGAGIYVIWALAIAVPALIFLRPGARRSPRDDDGDDEDARTTGIV